MFAVGVGVGALVIVQSNSSSKPAVAGRDVASAAHSSQIQSPTKSPASSMPEASAGTQPGRGESPPPGSPSGAQAGARATSQSISIISTAARSSFPALAATLGGEAGLAVAPLGEGPLQTLGGLQDGHAWSTMKVPVLTTMLDDYERSGRMLSSQEQTDAALALEQSDNTAAEALFAQLEHLHGGLVGASEAVQRTLANAGDTATHINTTPNDEGFTTWGQSLWSPSAEALFYRALARGCLLDSQDTDYVLGLMRQVIPEQRWGAGDAGYPSSLSLGFKGGWGPDANDGGAYLVRQTAIVGSGDSGYVLSMIAAPSGGAFAEGERMITALATWARQHLPVVASPSASCSAP